MKLFKFFLSTALLFLCLLFFSDAAYAQWNNGYQQLVNQKEKNPVSIDIITLPTKADSAVTMAAIFNLPYSYLPFKKNERANTNGEFYSNLEFSIEVFKSDKKKSSSKDQFSIKGLEPVARDFWSDTVYAASYEQSQSKNEFLNGYLQTSLPPGTYNYVFRMRRGQESKSKISSRRTVHISSFKRGNQENVIFGDGFTKQNGIPQLSLSRLGNDVAYGKDFYTLAHIPNYAPSTNYVLELNKLEVSGKDTSQSSTVYSHTLSDNNIKTGILPTLSKTKDNDVHLKLKKVEGNYTYALLQIPNKKLPNSLYRLTISKTGESPIVSETYRSIWVDMPRSLLSLDVSIKMLHYIVEDKTLDRLSSGSHEEREQKFRDFWTKRDPTPETAYNELMAEYYRRIDYAYDKFSTQNKLGHKSDRGKVYIKFGPPKNTKRKFPTNGPTTEIWTYPSTKFVFQATTGFGDFKLVSKEKL